MEKVCRKTSEGSCSAWSIAVSARYFFYQKCIFLDLLRKARDKYNTVLASTIKERAYLAT